MEKEKNTKFPISLSSLYNTLAIDMGGVVWADTWENVFLAPQIGLAAQYSLDPAEILAKGPDVFWDRHDDKTLTEEDYWQHWERLLRIRLDRALIENLKQQAIWIDPTAAPLIKGCLDAGMDVAIISNSTKFWHPEMMKRAELDSYEPRIKSYLSHELGVGKTHDQGGLKKFSALSDVSKTLFVDDRQSNLIAAGQLGMDTFHYQRDIHKSLGHVFAP